MSRESDERYTPKHVLDVVRMFADIYLDPCTTDDNRTQAERFFTSKEDGLSSSWYRGDGHRVVFVNPPYSRGCLLAWMRKIVSESEENEIIALIPSDLGTEAGQLVAQTADALCFVGGRLTFETPSGKLEAGAKQPSIMPYWGSNVERFARVFAQLGVVWTR